jgi:hypothetical protein
MKEGDVLMNRLSQAIGLWQCIVSCHESPAWVCAEISDWSCQTRSKVGGGEVERKDDVHIHQLDDEGIEEYVVVEIFGVLQWRSLEDIGWQ